MKKTFQLIIVGLSFWVTQKEAMSQTMLMWQKNYGGSDFEQPFGSEPTADGGIILGGHSISDDGDINSNNGDYDWWVFKINSAGNIVWQKSYGGSQYDKCRYATENPDG
ncbi:MAG: T9SS C-terminal target domain-containing protein, partial [Bacteroidia bacterium]